MIVNKRPWQSKKFIVAMLGLAVVTLEVLFGWDLPQETIVAQALVVLGYLGAQGLDDAKAKPEALRLEALKLEADLGKRPS